MIARAVTFLLVLALALAAGCSPAKSARREAADALLVAASNDLTQYVRSGWHLPVAVKVLISDDPAREEAEAALALRQMGAVREAQERAAFDFFAVELEVGSAKKAVARVEGADRRLTIELPTPGADGGAIISIEGILQALGESFAWDAVGPWYEGEPRAEIVAALRRDLAKLDAIEDELALECNRLDMIVGQLAARAHDTGHELLTPSETTFARGAQFRATYALHRVHNTMARWRAAGEDTGLVVQPIAHAVLQRARNLHEAYLDWLLDAIVGARPIFEIWKDDWWHRHPLYPILDAGAPLDFVDLDGKPPGSIPEGSVRALLRLRYDSMGACYEAIDDLGPVDVKALAGSALEKEALAAIERTKNTRSIVKTHEFTPLRAWKEHWDARLKGGFRYPFYAVIAKVSTWLGDTRTVKRPPALRGKEATRVAAQLRPGDILLVREDDFLSNAFLPGFWPHAILWLGDEAEWTALKLPDGRRLGDDGIVKLLLPRFREAAAHGSPPCAIEAVSEGVLFSSVEHCLSKDYAVGLRPELPEARRAEAIRRALVLHGRPYDFDFDFATDDKIVCTELVYRAYDEDLDFRIQVDAKPPGPSPRVPGLVPVVGRLTMPANEIARYAVHMYDHPQPDEGQRYPGKKLRVLFFADRKGPDAVVYQGEAALAPFRASVER
jgi:hypothetical protein